MTRPADGVQLMTPIGGHDDLLAHSTEERGSGTEMRSVTKLADEADEARVKAVDDQQFDIARQILAADLVPIIEPEIDLHSPAEGRGRGPAPCQPPGPARPATRPRPSLRFFQDRTVSAVVQTA